MTKAPPTIEVWLLVAFSLFIVTSATASLLLRLKLEKDLIIGAVRTFCQLFMMGYVLHYVFSNDNFFLIIGIFTWMIFWAPRIINKRIKDRPFEMQGPIFLTMLVTYILITSLTTGALLQVRPWYDPMIFIPIAGMVIGNSMNAIALSLDRLFSELKHNKEEIEQMLLFGADSATASLPAMDNAVRAGLMPSINSMMSVGLVFIPGMMTGQIIGGQAPIDAAKYQIMIMLMISASTAIGCCLVTTIIRKRCFNENHQLKY